MMMKKFIVFYLLLPVITVLSLQAQTPKAEGAHQAEYNTKQNEVDGESGPSKTLPDARRVSTSNEALSAQDSATTEQNMMISVANNHAMLDGTGNAPEATLNVAGSPVPRSSKRVLADQAHPEKIAPDNNTEPKKRKAEPTGKKKKRR
jgi:hypothetical protein